MKIHLKISAFIVYSFLIISCQKESDSLDPISNLDKESIQAIQFGNSLEIRQAYTLLKNYQKQKIWEVKLSTILLNDRHRLAPNQRKLILLLQDVLLKTKIENLIANPGIADDFVKSNINDFKKNFDVYQINLLIECAYFCEDFSIFKANQYLEKIDSPKNSYLNSRTVSFMASVEEPGFGGTKCNCLYDIYCSRDPQKNICEDKKSNDCEPQSGCGLFGTSTCTGICK
jgi:hypothetical protein